ncbi:MAG: hypothetical protein BWY76_00113 [bacterium ADurb.Bin429]|nr:MAG: hypothetical protein BWY76_00113 [bacterium ADurb.Bin429]
MIEIRKVDQERIPPAPAGDHAARVEIDRHPTDQRDDEHARRHPREDADDAEGSPGAPHIQTYGPEGHVEEHELPGTEVRQIDFTA